MTEHSPVPWRRSHETTDGIYIYDANDDVVAIVRHSSGSGDVDRANARLIVEQAALPRSEALFAYRDVESYYALVNTLADLMRHGLDVREVYAAVDLAREYAEDPTREASPKAMHWATNERVDR